ncbi:MAG TPA: quinone-dependent dihydroorotate dehydrogenase [Bacteroidales bacterium]|nr:quinone-dependent dihydroorotate dehydrogenase [Bacteroidales bacterium]HPR58571.1 quinone-dependent dihydroorotate dehydrogenase [Bacteroidales bacterium]HRW96610.1 quinone-dependent dihydroorotate dehydrogenase [Bacteroidales bacterium]
MYKQIIRPLLFILPPEFIHNLVVSGLKFFFRIPGKKWMTRKISLVINPNLEREIFGLKFRNPVGIAAGFDKQALLFNELANFGFGFVEIGTLTPLPQPGNPKPRLFRLPKDRALINRMGFNNIGVDEAIKNLKNRKTDIIIGGNIGKNTATPNEQAAQDYLICFEKLFDYVDYFVVNVSCPNISNLQELQDKENLLEILGKLQLSNNRKQNPKPILLKISPDLTNNQLDELIEIVAETKISGIVATNTSTSRNNLKTNARDLEKIGNGGLSGQPVRNRSTEIIRYLAEKSGKAFPIIGSGGVFTPEDALEKINAGADLVQVYTGFIYEGPLIGKKINKRLLNS